MIELFTKSPLKTPPKKGMSVWETSLSHEDIINNPSDLAKLLFVLKNGINAEEWPVEGVDLRQFVVGKVTKYFEDSGESAVANTIEIALEYGIIGNNTDTITGLKRYVVYPKSEVDISHDWFCFDCDKMISKTSRQFLKCGKCLRIFHRKCTQEYESVKDYKCRYCLPLETSETNGYINESQRVDQKRMSRLIGFLLDFVKRRMKQKFEELDLKFANEENEFIYVYKKMSLSLMQQKVEREEYSSILEFNADFCVYMHNLFITQIEFNTTEMAQNFAALRILMLKEVEEMKKCVDCYERANDKIFQESNKEWLCMPCAPTHKPVFVKMKSCPYWPAKVIKADGPKSEVCFFEAEKVKSKGGNQSILRKSEAKNSEIKDIDDSDVLNHIKGNQRLIKPIEMLVKYLELMPNNEKSLYIDVIEVIKQNNSPQKTTNNESSITDSIESAIKSGLKTPSKPPSKPPSKARPKKKESASKAKKGTSKQTSEMKRIEKRGLSPNSSNASTRSSSPYLPKLEKYVSTCAESFDPIASISDGVTDCNLSEGPPEIDLFSVNDSKTNRRSGRIAALTTPQKTDSKKKSEVKSVKASKRKDNKKSTEECEQMDVDMEGSQQTTQPNESSLENMRIDSEMDKSVPQSSQSVPIIVDNSQQNIAIGNENKICSQSSKSIDSNTTSQQLEGKSQSSIEINRESVSNIGETSEGVVSEKYNIAPMYGNSPAKTKTAVTTTTVTSIAMSTTTTPLMCQTITTPLTATASQSIPLVVETPFVSVEALTPLISMPSTSASPSFGGVPLHNQMGVNSVSNNFDTKEMMDRLKERIHELRAMTVLSVNKYDVDDKITLIETYQKRLFETLSERIDRLSLQLNQTQIELQNSRVGRWCVVCHQMAKHYCCVRFYCSKECQRVDWRNGHHSQCLDRLEPPIN